MNDGNVCNWITLLFLTLKNSHDWSITQRWYYLTQNFHPEVNMHMYEDASPNEVYIKIQGYWKKYVKIIFTDDIKLREY